MPPMALNAVKVPIFFVPAAISVVLGVGENAVPKIPSAFRTGVNDEPVGS